MRCRNKNKIYISKINPKLSIIHSYSIDLERKIFKLQLKAETITVIGDYDINAKFLILPIIGKGPSNITLRKYHTFIIFHNF